jgi:hypothetical protein
VYAGLVAEALNQGQSDLAGLPLWFQAMSTSVQQPQAVLHMVDATPPPGYVGSYILEIRHQGSAFIWLLQTASGFQAYPLLAYFDFIHESQANWILTDLDNNPTNGEEIAIYRSTLPNSIWACRRLWPVVNTSPPDALPARREYLHDGSRVRELLGRAPKDRGRQRSVFQNHRLPGLSHHPAPGLPVEPGLLPVRQPIFRVQYTG